MNETMRELYLADNRLQATDAIQLGNLLKYNYTLRLLDIRNNHVHDVGLAHITDGLREQVRDPICYTNRRFRDHPESESTIHGILSLPFCSTH